MVKIFFLNQHQIKISANKYTAATQQQCAQISAIFLIAEVTWKKCVRKYTWYKTELNKTRMDEIRKEYEKAKDTARSLGWKKLCSEMDDLTATARMSKVMKMGKKINIGTLR